MASIRYMRRSKAVRSLTLIMCMSVVTLIYTAVSIARSPEQGTFHSVLAGNPSVVKVPSKVDGYDMVPSDTCNDKCQDAIQANRLRKAAEVCSQVDNSKVRSIEQSLIDRLDHVVVLDRYKLLFCYVPKVACTNWKRTLLILLGLLGHDDEVSHLMIHSLAMAKLPTLKNLNTEEAVRRLNSYKKVMFVREPISRFLSAYRDKLEKPLNADSRAFRRGFSSRIKGINAAELGVQNAVEFNVTFYDFISYLGNPRNKLASPPEEHWRSVNELCSPCTLQYDFIGRMETLERDRNYVLKHFFEVDPISYRLHTSTNPTNSSKLRDDYIAEIPEKRMRALYERFRIDFDAFGYATPLS
ncbi:carbohydrate sulfotransferase 11-like isoform X3 [Apostichopus japonicus]|uniref:carbohydrate sulfotransferase 11-like isoform X3 n=1 Tax=Stichopus japonicus TaxID=307972 RepID=UPI003AB2A7EF